MSKGVGSRESGNGARIATAGGGQFQIQNRSFLEKIQTLLEKIQTQLFQTQLIQTQLIQIQLIK